MTDKPIMKTIKFPGSDLVYEVTDMYARQIIEMLQADIKKLQEDVKKLQEGGVIPPTPPGTATVTITDTEGKVILTSDSPDPFITDLGNGKVKITNEALSLGIDNAGHITLK